MKESIGYTATLNIVIVFITIIIAFFWFGLIYFKSNKVSNVITSAIEKYEGYNSPAINEIKNNLNALGYGSHSIDCAPSVVDKGANSKKSAYEDIESIEGICNLTTDTNGRGSLGYCVYECYEYDETGNYEYYYFKIRTNMMIGVPIVNDILDFPIYSNTNRLYKFN